MNVYSSEFIHIVEFADRLNLMCFFVCVCVLYLYSHKFFVIFTMLNTH